MVMVVAVYALGGITEDMDTGGGPLLAYVNNVDIEVQDEQDPLRVFLSVSGRLPNPCAEIEPASIERLQEVFLVTVSYRSVEACDGPPRAFNERIELNVAGVTQGEYYVDVNGYPDMFEVDGAVTIFDPEGYSPASFGLFPALERAVEKSDLVISIDSLEPKTDEITDLYQKTAINFAGHYVVLGLDCEAAEEVGCYHLVIIDALTGRTVQSLQYEGFNPYFELESRMLVINDPYQTQLNEPYEVKFLIMVDGALPYLHEIATSRMNEYYEES